MAPLPRGRAAALLLVLAGCAGASAHAARIADITRRLDEVRLAQSPGEAFVEVRLLLHEKGYPLTGKDRDLLGLPQRSLDSARAGFATSVGPDGTHMLETNVNAAAVRVRALAVPLAGGGCRVTFTRLWRNVNDPSEQLEKRDIELEVELLERLDPAAAALVMGKPAPIAAAAPGDTWGPVRHLLGTWVSEGPPGQPEIRWTFAFIDGEQFLEMRGSSILGPPGAGGASEMGRISRDPIRRRLVWRQFTAGGQVNQYTLVRSSADAVVFESDSPESLPPGSQARLTLGRAGPDEILAVFELAEPGKGFAVAGESRLRRVP